MIVGNAAKFNSFIQNVHIVTATIVGVTITTATVTITTAGVTNELIYGNKTIETVKLTNVLTN